MTGAQTEVRRMTNHPSGFHGFVGRIEAMTEGFGGGANVRNAVGQQFEEALKAEICASRGLKPWSLTHHAPWTLATDGDFDAAGRAVEKVWSRVRAEIPAEAVAPWNGVSLALRGDCAWIEGGGQALLVAGFGPPHRVWSSRARKQVENWSVHIHDAGKICATGSAYGGPGPASTHAKSDEGARKALRAIVERFFEVRFEDVEASAARATKEAT